ncbi:general secretion pathway protein J [Caulobacter sp. BE264]|uniref:type II secretion system minor pseudopilin GspJ n=1 Tax=Caulobacter sp. BE264 TaxID=2817724 RepID=UPI00285E1B86|nr:type II secretion system minor pseudopilin GspJ [Caulobacter sp. BE264]MDR7229897.1 general secretion pathway protein J [Caulobacter sp. BE264]
MKGFTLIEMMVALLIFALITAAGVAVMSSTLNNQTAVRVRVERYAELQRMRAVLKADLSQAAARRTRGEDGLPALTAFAGVSPWAAGGPLLAFARRGYENSDQAPRASLQYVEYALVEGRLERRARPALDGARLGPAQVLLTGVESIQSAYLFDGVWRPTWRGEATADIPAAVRLTMKLKDLGEIDQLFLTSGEGR